MAVSDYTPKSFFGCDYRFRNLRNEIYLVPENHVKKIMMGGTYAYIVSVDATSILQITGFNINFKEETSLDERYKFQKTLTISVDGYATFEKFEEKYYAIIKNDNDGSYYMINVDFPSNITYTYNLSDNTNQTDFTFSSVSNFPTLGISSFSFDKINICKNYKISGAKDLHMIESKYAALTGNRIITTNTLKEIDYLKNSLTFQESYNEGKISTTLEFQINFDEYKEYFKINLLNFTTNKYSVIIGLKNDEKKIYAGFNSGLEANYSIQASSMVEQPEIVTITLSGTSNNNLYYSICDETFDFSRHWRYITKINNRKAYECVDRGVAKYLIREQCDYLGNPLGIYRVLDGYQDLFPDIRFGGVFYDVVTFISPDCYGRIEKTKWEFAGNYYCIDGNKYEAVQEFKTDDNGKTWNKTGEAILGNLVETDSQWCEDNPPTYSWKLTDLYECEGQI